MYFLRETSWIERKIFSEHLMEVSSQEYSFYFDFLPDIGFGYDLSDSRTTWLNTRSFEFAGTVGKEFAFKTQYFESIGKFPRYLDHNIRKNSIVPGQGYIRYYSPTEHEYGYSNGVISYSPSSYINIQIGQDKNFIGNGYRSLLLSDISFNYPFMKLISEIWNLQYSIMWAQFQEPKPIGQSIDRFWPKKFGVFHYIDWNITNRFSLGLFEAVMWKAIDTISGYRGFDLNYLNPLIIFRPIEHSMNSPDKMKIGLNWKYNISSENIFYGQLLLDEMVVNEFVSARGFWGNKYAIQVGVKSFDAFDIKDLYLQEEFNTATPYTYSHSDPITNYSHYEQPLAHPLGANFYEGIIIGSFRRNRWDFYAKFNYAIYGDDTLGVNYGKDIYKSYNTRKSDYGNYTTQGLKTLLYFIDFRIAYILNPLINLRLELGMQYRNCFSDFSKEKSTWITFGIRSSFRNIYYDF
jgi:hypothetical protein